MTYADFNTLQASGLLMGIFLLLLGIIIALCEQPEDKNRKP